MVLKQSVLTLALEFRFESSVNSDGTQTSTIFEISSILFESSVNSDGTQTPVRLP